MCQRPSRNTKLPVKTLVVTGHRDAPGGQSRRHYTLLRLGDCAEDGSMMRFTADTESAGKAAAFRVLTNSLLIGRSVDAVHLVAAHVALYPLDRRALALHVLEHPVRLGGYRLNVLVRQLPAPGPSCRAHWTTAELSELSRRIMAAMLAVC
jgi:hypothetical protein